MNILIWIVQGLLAFAFVMSGSMKLMRSKEQLGETMGWVEDFSQGFIRTISTLEMLAGVGLILPMLVGVLPWLTPVAAVGLVVIMIGAATTHARRGNEGRFIGVTSMMLALAAFVAIGRFWIVPV
jgi:uncharacterized membrane protein YphA (DoxX/SURF4 family)